MNHCRPPQNWSLECGAVQIAARHKSSQTTDGQYLIRFCKVLYRTLVRQYVSIRRMFLKPYLSDDRKMMTVNISDAAVESAPIPASRATCPKNTMHDTIVHTSQVYGCGLTFLWMISRR